MKNSNEVDQRIGAYIAAVRRFMDVKRSMDGLATQFSNTEKKVSEWHKVGFFDPTPDKNLRQSMGQQGTLLRKEEWPGTFEEFQKLREEYQVAWYGLKNAYDEVPTHDRDGLKAAEDLGVEPI